MLPLSLFFAMVRLLFSMMFASAASSTNKTYLVDHIVPPEVVPGRRKFEIDEFDVIRDVFDKILRNHGFHEDRLSSLPPFIISHHKVTMSPLVINCSCCEKFWITEES